MVDAGDSPNAVTGNLTAIASRGIALNYASQLLRFVLQIGYQIAIARLLMPEQFGIVAMASPLIALIGLVGNLGLTQAAIQRPQISDAEMSTLFWLNVGINVLLAGIVIAASPLVAAFYNQPAVTPILAVLAVTTIVTACGSQHMVVLNRQLRFGTIAIIDFVSFVTGAIVSLAAALAGFGIWAIVTNQVVISVVTTLALWSMVRWRPILANRSAGSRQLIGFGADVAVANTANFFARNLDNVLIGKVWGGEALGAYDRAYRLLLSPLTQITVPMTKIAVPLLSRVQHDAAAYCRAYFLMLELVLGLTYPAVIMALVTHDQFIRVFLGPQWMAASPIFAILAVGALFAPIGNSMSWLLISQNRTSSMRNYTVASSIAFAVGIVAGLPWGPVGVAAGYIGVGLIQGPITWAITTRLGPVDRNALAGSLMPFALASVPVLGVTLLLQRLLSEGFVALLLILIASYLTFLIAILAQQRSRESLIFLVAHMREILDNRVRL
jgi:PST family polysaccharide transporter